MAFQLLIDACGSKEAMLRRKYADYSFLGFLISPLFLGAGLLIVSYTVLKKFFRWIYNNPQKAILLFTAFFFLATWLFPPFIRSGQIYYSFFLTPTWNGSRIFWALLLVEWTIILLALGLIYKRLAR
jgi:hypothetical protein